MAIVKGDVSDGKPVLCRVHSECLTGDALGSRRCDCGQQYRAAIQMIEKAKKPYIFVGGGAILSGASEVLKTFVEKQMHRSATH